MGAPEREVAAGIAVDWTRCRGRGICHELLAARMSADPWGFPIIDDAGPLRADELDDARQAQRQCPLAAFIVTGSAGRP